MTSTVDITSTLRRALPGRARRIPFARIARMILPSRYSLSVAFTGNTRARTLNQKYRNKRYVPNVLAFPLAENEGEIILNIRKAEREARTFKTRPETRITYLYIHALLHLAGYRHGTAMEKQEHTLLKQFGF